MELIEKIKNNKIVLYGLSTETERVLNEWAGKYNVIGLLDGFKTEGEQFGYPIVDINNAVKQDNVIIIVVARPGSCKAITKRIGDICKSNNVELFDIRGKNLLADTKVVYDFKKVRGYTKEELLNQMMGAKAISFDLFDTLVVRDVLSFNDVLELVRVGLEERGFTIPDFVNKRIGAEKRLSIGKAPRLEAIYEELLKTEQSIVAQAGELAEFEYRIDCDLIRARADVVALIKEAKKNGKLIYVTSESYYSKTQIVHILNNNNIKDIDGVIVSCEYGRCKTGNLFNKLIDIVGTDNILHIGDDIVADIESAKRHGLKAFQIYSSSELLDAIGGLNLVERAQNLSDRIRVGMFVADIFNSPFQFEDEDKKIHVDSTQELGYLLCAPIILDFIKWFGEQVKENEIKNIWFCARDGYLLQKLYKLLYPSEKTDYFLTSRIAAIRAGVSDIADIEYVDSMKYSGEVSDNLYIRFGIKTEELLSNHIDDEQTGLLKYSTAILSATEQKRINNLKYIESLKVNEGGIALVDFVAKGTSQMYIQKLVPNNIVGLYFLQLEPEFMKDKGIIVQPFYTENERETSAIFDNYYILETLLTSPYPSVDEFNVDGRPKYAKETRAQKDIECFMEAQDGIIAYIERYLDICPCTEFTINKKLDEAFLTLVHNIDIRDKNFLSLTVEDPFFNRMTEMTDLI